MKNETKMAELANREGRDMEGIEISIPGSIELARYTRICNEGHYTKHRFLIKINKQRR